MNAQKALNGYKASELQSDDEFGKELQHAQNEMAKMMDKYLADQQVQYVYYICMK